ncbi:MAG: cobalamin-dependent protein [Candidatus Eisenbacteria sp.]|nr:cobalamin-dependent protein [Candidatus Eisenbacteria bacterium]
MNILAIYPQEPELPVFEKMPPLGMLWIAGELRRAGHQVVFLDEQVENRDAGHLAAELHPALALLGGTSHCRFRSFEIAASLKRHSPETTVVYGGPHATFAIEDTLAHIPTVDVIVRGEGEQACLELAQWASHGKHLAELSGIKGIGYRDNGRIARTSPRAINDDLDSLGPPARDLVPMARYHMMMDYMGIPGASVITARGCPIGCTFCSAAAMFGKSYRTRNPSLVVDEIEGLLSDYGIQGIKIFDSTFTLQRSHAEGFCAELLDRRIQIPWECEIRVGSVDKRLLATMQQAGCYYVDVGVESGSQRVLDHCIRKRTSVSDAEQLLRWTRELGLLTKVFFTIGHPGETWPEACETNRFIRRNRRSIRLAAYQAGIKIYPGTAVETFARERNLMPAGFHWSKPYTNTLNRSLFRPVDSIPLLIQPGMGLRELRRLRLGFIALRVSSPRFVWEKLKAIVQSRAIPDYLRILLRGALLRCAGRSPSGKAVPPSSPARRTGESNHAPPD